MQADVVTKTKVVVLFLVVITGYLLMWPTALDPVSWEAPEAPKLEGIYAPNTYLTRIERMDMPANGRGPEDVAVDAMGRIYGGLADGRIIRHDPALGKWDLFVDTGGRPLGLDFDGAGNLIVADSFRGLLSISPQGSITELCQEEGGVPFKITDDVVVAPDGLIYFTDASFKYDLNHYKMDGMEHRGNGRLLVYDPSTREVRLLLKDLYFANGLALSADGASILFSETWKYRIQRYWLKGERAGETEVVLDNLPGFPDGVSCDEQGNYWVALASTRNALLDQLSDNPFLRKVISRFPQSLQPKPARYPFILGLDPDGKLIHNLQDPTGSKFAYISSVEPHGDKLYLGSLLEPAYGVLALPINDIPRETP